MSEPEEPKTYAIRPTEQATRDVEAALSWLSERDGTEEDPTPEASVRLALAWFDAYEAARATLANFPSRCALVPERAHFSQETRHLIFRRSPDAPPMLPRCSPDAPPMLPRGASSSALKTARMARLSGYGMFAMERVGPSPRKRPRKSPSTTDARTG